MEFSYAEVPQVTEPTHDDDQSLYSYRMTGAAVDVESGFVEPENRQTN